MVRKYSTRIFRRATSGNNLLNRRLMRSLWGSKLRLIAVFGMIFVGVFSGITFSGYSSNLGPMYESLYEDTDSGSNLADIWIDNKTQVWTPDQLSIFCSSLESNWNNNLPAVDGCEGRIIQQGVLFHKDQNNERIVTSLIHGIHPEADIDRNWFPSGYTEGAPAVTENEIVIDAHVTEALSLELGDLVRVGVGNGSHEFLVVGKAYHPLHVFLAPEGSIFPPEDGDYAVGYVSDLGMARLTGNIVGSSNTIMIDIDGIPEYDLPTTDRYEGEVMDEMKELIESSMLEAGVDGRIRDRGQNEQVELMRQDLESSQRFATPFTILIQSIAAITIALSLQRLVQSQSREIAILRTLGVPRTSIMQGYLIAPVVIGAPSCLIGALASPYGVDAMLDFYESIVGLPIIDRDVSFGTYSSILGVTMGIVIVSGVVPAWRATRIDPLEILSGRTDIQVGSRFLQSITGWMPARLGLSIRSSLRKPTRLGMTLIAVGISLMLAGSIQMMTVALKDSVLGGLSDDQTWDKQAFIVPGGENDIIQWADQVGAEYESIIEISSGALLDDSGSERAFSAIALANYTQGSSMRSVEITDGEPPSPKQQPIEVMMDEGSLRMLGWDLGEPYYVKIGATEIEVLISGTTGGEFSRTMYFTHPDLSEISGLNATSLYLQLPDGVSENERLAEMSAGILDREDLLDGVEDLLNQQTQFLNAVMGLGVLFTLAVMFNTMVMNIAERDFELATLRVLGASRFSLGGMLLAESLIIGLIGGLIGVCFAFAGAVGLAASFSTWQFYFPVTLVPEVAYQLIGIVLAISVAMVPIGIFRITRMDLVAKVKDLSH